MRPVGLVCKSLRLGRPPRHQRRHGSPVTFLPLLRSSVGELEEGLGVIAVGGVAGLQRLCGGGLPMRVGGGGVGALAGAAACLRAGAGLLHLPSLRQRGLIHILKAKPLPLVFVKGLGEKRGNGDEGGRIEDVLAILTYGRQLWVVNHSSQWSGEHSPKHHYIQTPCGVQQFAGRFLRMRLNGTN